MRRTTTMFVVLAAFVASIAPAGAVDGGDTAKEKAAQLINAVGGADVWGRSQSFTVRERVFLENGETANVVVKRNLDDIARWISLNAETFAYEEVIEKEYGWSGRDGAREVYSESDLAIERGGLEQSPYYVYHRLAKDDPALRVVWTESERRLTVFEGERELCWFFLDGRGNPMSWANYYGGHEVRHNYGPLIDIGDANFPKWGAAADASWRFEYLEATFSDKKIAMPTGVTE